jgi:hypothetical protein
VDAEGGVVVEADEDFFAAAVDGGDAAIGKQGDKIGGGRGDDVGAEVMDVTDAVANEVGDESADDVLYLGELGHCNFYLKGASVKMTNEFKWLEYIRQIARSALEKKILTPALSRRTGRGGKRERVIV